jgi:GAF domain-containing protein
MPNQPPDYFRIFFETSQNLLSSLSARETLKLLVKRTVHALGCKAGSLLLVNPETNQLELAASHLLSKKYLAKGRLHLDRSIPEVMQKRIVYIADAATDPRVEYRAEKRVEGIHGVLAVPLVARDQVIGVLRLYTSGPRDFHEEELEFASALAEMGGLAIANARIYEDQGVQLHSLLQGLGVQLPETGRRKQRFRSFAPRPTGSARTMEEFRALRAITTTILSALDASAAQERIVTEVVATTGAKGGALRLLDETTGELVLTASRGLSQQYLDKGTLHADRSIQEALTGVPVLVDDAANDPRVEYPAAAAREGIASILSVPIIARERVIGVLRLYSATQGRYSRDDVVFVSALAEIAGVAIANARLYARTTYDLAFWQTTARYLGEGREPGSR